MKNEEMAEIRHLLDTGYFRDMVQLLTKLEWRYLYNKLGMVHRTVSRRSKQPGSFKVSELRGIAKIIGVKTAVIYDLVDKAIDKKEKK